MKHSGLVEKSSVIRFRYSEFNLPEQFEFVVAERKSRMGLAVGLEQIGTSMIEFVELVGMSTDSAVVEHIHTVSSHGSHCPELLFLKH